MNWQVWSIIALLENICRFVKSFPALRRLCHDWRLGPNWGSILIFSYASSSTLYPCEWVSGWAEFQTSVASRLASLFLSNLNELVKCFQFDLHNLFPIEVASRLAFRCRRAWGASGQIEHFYKKIQNLALSLSLSKFWLVNFLFQGVGKHLPHLPLSQPRWRSGEICKY